MAYKSNCGIVTPADICMNETITIRVPDGERAKIERIIKREYPKLKTMSDVVRVAVTEFIEKHPLGPSP